MHVLKTSRDKNHVCLISFWILEGQRLQLHPDIQRLFHDKRHDNRRHRNLRLITLTGFASSSDPVYISIFIIAGVFSGSMLWWLTLSTFISMIRSKLSDNVMERIQMGINRCYVSSTEGNYGCSDQKDLKS